MKSNIIRYRLTRISPDTVKLVFELKNMHKKATLTAGGMTFSDAFNDREPYDRKSHVFYVPGRLIKNGSVLTLRGHDFLTGILPSAYKITLSDPVFLSEEELYEECDNALSVKEEQTERLCDGVSYTHRLCENRNGAPVHVFALTADMNKADLYTGTPDDGYAPKKVKATIPEMIEAANKNGKQVVASINGDFFDIFGDMHPSGLVIKNGLLVANPYSERPFIGMTKNGEAVVTDIKESPEIIGSLECAVSGLQRIVKDGKLHDWARLESFGYTRHPRSAAGITAEGKVVLTVVDGRIPDYSNGASLVDLANIMLSFGCVEAINLDGGGSSAVYTRKDGEYELRSNPADLFKPNDKLIRKEANCIMVTEK